MLIAIKEKINLKFIQMEFKRLKQELDRLKTLDSLNELTDGGKQMLKELEVALSICEVMDWVGVNDELPIPYVNVLVTFKNEGNSSIRTGFWDGSSWLVNGNKPLLTEEITFWKQIESPPCA